MLYRLRIVLFWLTLIGLLLSGSAASQASSIRVGFAQGYGLLVNERGSHAGYIRSYLSEITRYTGWDYEFVQCGWEECLEKLRTGEIDAMGPLQKTEARAKNMLYPQHPQGYEYGALYTLASNSRLFFNDYAGFDGMRVASLISSYFVENFEKYRIENNFKVTYVYVNDYKDLLEALASGEADAFISGNLLVAPNVKVLAKFAVDPFYFAFSKKNPEALVRFNDAVELLRTDDIYFDAKLFDEFYSDSTTSQPAFTRKEIEFIKNAPEYTLALDPDWAPLEYRDPETGAIQGIIPDLLRMVERNTGLRFRFADSDTYQQAQEKFYAGQVDMVTMRLPRTYSNDFVQRTEPLITVPLMLVGRADVQPTRDMVIGMMRFTAFESDTANLYDSSRMVLYNNLHKALEGLYSGEVSGLLINTYAFDDLVRSSRFRDLRLLSATRYTIPINIGVNDTTGGLLISVLNKGISRMTQDEINSKIFSSTITPPPPVTIMEVFVEYAYPLTISGCIFLLILFGAILTNKQHVEKMLTEVAFIDGKTGLGNWNRMEHSGQALLNDHSCFVTMDVNNFKLLNDYFGYDVGDRALQHIADELKLFVKHGELAVRAESDVFCLLLRVSTESDLRDRLSWLTSRLIAFRPLNDETGFTMSLSFGICMNTVDSVPVPTLRDRATIARKLFKNVYRTTYAFYDEEIHTHIMQEREIENKMADALQCGEFEAYYQPKYDLRNDCIVGAEALVRWRSPEQGMILPCNFIPLFERNGFIVRLDMYILESVCRSLQAWIGSGFTPVPVSVNISKLHVLNPDFVNDVLHVIQKYNIPPRLIELELTETAFLENTELLLHIMNEFAEKGFTLSMDDFGTGYSSLNMLQEIPVHVLKLDRAFLDMSNDNSRAKNIIAHVVHMAKDLNMQVVSEGVETVDHVRFLKHVGCDMAQGFFYSPPVPVDAFRDMAFRKPLSCEYHPIAIT